MFKILSETFIKKNFTIHKIQGIKKLKNIYRISTRTSEIFKYAIANGLLDYEELYYIKDLINSYIFINGLTKHYNTQYNHIFHEIFDKLQSNSLSEKQFLYIYNYIGVIVEMRSRK